MISWLGEHWGTIVAVLSVIANALGAAGVVPPVRTPPGFARLEEQDGASKRG